MVNDNCAVFKKRERLEKVQIVSCYYLYTTIFSKHTMLKSSFYAGALLDATVFFFTVQSMLTVHVKVGRELCMNIILLSVIIIFIRKKQQLWSLVAELIFTVYAAMFL